MMYYWASNCNYYSLLQSALLPIITCYYYSHYYLWLLVPVITLSLQFSLLPIITIYIITHYYSLLHSIITHYYSLLQMWILCNNGTIITYYYFACFHYYFIITHYYCYYLLLHIMDWRTCRCLQVQVRHCIPALRQRPQTPAFSNRNARRCTSTVWAIIMLSDILFLMDIIQHSTTTWSKSKSRKFTLKSQ